MNGMTDIKDGFSQTILDNFKALADEQYIGDNDYIEPVDIPVYNSGDASHCLIGTDGDWNNTTLNDDTWEHFYVPAGDYSGVTITLTADGTDVARRTISLHNGNDTHPASLAEVDQANILFVFDNADYWTIDRMSIIDQVEADKIRFDNGSSYNIINRLNMVRYEYGMSIYNANNYNTIQNSYFDHMTHIGRMNDNVCIAMTLAGFGDGGSIIGTKVINNDFRNAGDAFQTVASDTSWTINFEGTIVDSNRMWMDGDVYTNGDYGTTSTYDPNGEYQIGENSLDFKAGSENANNPIIVSNNMLWGYQQGDKTAGGSWTSGAGRNTTWHYGVKNLHFLNNILLDSQTFFEVNSEGTAHVGSIIDCIFRDNIMYHGAYVNPDGDTMFPAYFYNTNGVTIEDNSFIDFDSGSFIRFQTSKTGGIFRRNLMIDAATSSGNDGWSVTDSYQYNSPNSLGGTGHTILPTAAEANMTDYSFQYERFTTSPKTKTLTGVISTESSPHYGVAGSDIK